MSSPSATVSALACRLVETAGELAAHHAVRRAALAHLTDVQRRVAQQATLARAAALARLAGGPERQIVLWVA